jgi:hypothetical protein
MSADKDKTNISVGVGATVVLSPEAATQIGNSIRNVGSNIGLAGTVGALAAGVAKSVSKSAIPPVQKAGIVVAASILGAGIHIGASAINRSNSGAENPGPNGSGNFKNLVAGSENSPLEDLLFSLDIINYACLSLVIILLMIILFKFYLNEDKLNLNLS